MECLQHADEKHFTQDEEFFCPVCIPVQSSTPENYTFTHLLADICESVICFEKKYVEKYRTDFKSPRAPPFIA